MLEYDVILINPPVSFKKMPDDEIVIKYFETLKEYGKYMLGDDDAEPNYGLLSIAAKIRQDRAETKIKIIDFNLVDKHIRKTENRGIGIQDIRQELNGYRATIAGISFMTSSYGVWGAELISEVRQICDYLFLGGIHPTVRYREVYDENANYVDGVIVGEGEYIFSEITKEIIDGKGNNYRNHPNIYTDADINRSVARSILNNRQLSDLPLPAYDLLYKEHDQIIPRVYTTRGCTNNCKMCSVGDFYKTKSKQDLVNVDIARFQKDIQELHEKYSIKHFVMGDLTLSENNPRFKKILKILTDLRQSKTINEDWWCQTRGDLLNEDSAKKMKKAGFKQVAIGCEAATNQQLKDLNKGEKVRTIRRSLQLLRRYDINTQGYWILGVPRESKDSIKRTQEAIIEYLEKDLVTVPHVTILVPYPNTELAKRQQGIEIFNRNYSDYWMNCDLYGYGKPVYNTVDENGKVLLTSDEIYEAWLETLKQITKFMEDKYNGN